MGTFSKVMFPGIRLAYLVLPEDLVDPFVIGNSELFRGGRMSEQAALAEFIDDGHFSAHIKRMRAKGSIASVSDALREVMEFAWCGADCVGRACRATAALPLQRAAG